jgi:hypothetical protein
MYGLSEYRGVQHVQVLGYGVSTPKYPPIPPRAGVRREYSRVPLKYLRMCVPQVLWYSRVPLLLQYLPPSLPQVLGTEDKADLQFTIEGKARPPRTGRISVYT